ncbi:hypothetical protein FF1_013607 [Malus domestica]
MKLAQKGIIKLDLDDVVKSNYTTITSSSFNSKSLPRLLEACSNSCQPSKLHESVEDDETSTRRSSVPITMRDFFPKDFFNHSVKTPCYEDCEERLSKIA